MVVGVIADRVPGGERCEGQLREPKGVGADLEEGRMTAMAREKIEDMLGVPGVGPVIEAHRDDLLLGPHAEHRARLSVASARCRSWNHRPRRPRPRRPAPERSIARFRNLRAHTRPRLPHL